MRKCRKLLAVVLAAMMVLPFAAPAMAATYSDTEGHWANDAISRWSDMGVIQGADGYFRPQDPITRAETATIINNVIGYIETAANSFSDVPNDAWYADAILKLNKAGVMIGGDGVVRPQDRITREDATVIFHRAFGVKVTSVDPMNYGDVDTISGYASDIIAQMSTIGYIKGDGVNFRPKDSITRAEIVTLLDNMVGLYITESGTYSGNYGKKYAVIKSGNVAVSGATLGGAVVSPTVGTQSVNFGSGTQITGNLTNLATNAKIVTTGATVASATGVNLSVSGAGTTATPSIIGGGYSGSSSSGGGSSSGSSSSTTKYTTYFYANLPDGKTGGWMNNNGIYKAAYTTTNKSSAILSDIAPDKPYCEGYEFEGWYLSASAADVLNSAKRATMSAKSSKGLCLYAGWSKKAIPAFEISSSDSLLGKKATDLMTDVKFEEDDENENSYLVRGTLNYIDDYAGFSSIPEQKQGHFLAIDLELPYGAKDVDVTKTVIKYEVKHKEESVENTITGFTEDDYTLTAIFQIRDVECSITYTIDLDGEDDEFEEMVYTFDLSALKLETLKSVVIFGVNASEENDLLGKNAAALMSNDVEIKKDDEDECNHIVTGTLPYIDDFTAFSSDTTQQKGNYLVLDLELPYEDIDVTKAVVTYEGENGEKTYSDFTDENYTLTTIFRISDKDTIITYTVDLDGANAEYEATTFTFDVSNLVLETPPVVVFSVSESDNLLEKAAGDFMDGVTIVADTKTENKYQVSGILKYVSGFDAFSNVVEQQSGNYLVLELELPYEDIDVTKAVVTYEGENGEKTYSDFTDDDYSLTTIFRISSTTTKITYTIDLDGEGTEFEPTTYILDLTGLELIPA